METPSEVGVKERALRNDPAWGSLAEAGDSLWDNPIWAYFLKTPEFPELPLKRGCFIIS